MPDFVSSGEKSYFVENIHPFALLDVGSKKWLECHAMIIKLSQQATLEALEHREEEVKEFLILKDKLKILIHEAYCTFIWKTRVLPHLLDVDPNPHATFLIYAVFYHEGAVVSLLDSALFHGSGCEALQDAAIDLVDYCTQGIAQLIGLASMGHHENVTNYDVDEAVLTELERQKRDLIFKIGLRCISILSYLADNSKALPLSAALRMVTTHDVPCLMVDLLFFRPWQRRTTKGLEKYVDEKWTAVRDMARVVKHEAQTWFCLRQLLFQTNFMGSYEINEERRKQLAKCQGLLHESILDQLPPLIELKQYLCQLVISSSGSGQSSKPSRLLLDEVPQIRDNIIIEAERAGGFLEIAQQQESIFLCADRQQILSIAQSLNAAYNTDLLAELEGTIAELAIKSTEKGSGNECGNCLESAEKKCSNCQAVYYCSKKCQLDHWPRHKKQCIKM